MKKKNQGKKQLQRGWGVEGIYAFCDQTHIYTSNIG